MSKYFLVTWGTGYQARPRIVSQDELLEDEGGYWSGGDYAEWDAHMEKLDAIDVSETIVLADTVSPDNSCEVFFTRVTIYKYRYRYVLCGHFLPTATSRDMSKQHAAELAFDAWVAAMEIEQHEGERNA
tara:strand:- start:2100 stop:2486 length:387 start_codon:yes stop_codon:yes gene_type:complete